MPSFMLKVPNDDDGLDLGTYEADYLPRVGDLFFLYHPALCADEDPFEARVESVVWEAFNHDHKYARGETSVADAIVWITEHAGTPTFYCTCTEKEKELHVADKTAEVCSNCGCKNRDADR